MLQGTNRLRIRDNAESAQLLTPTSDLEAGRLGGSPERFCSWSRACLTSCSEGRAEDCEDVWDADLRVEKRQSRRAEAVTP
jgi:hypothetical protein